jgi:hypothetical protein
VSRLNCIEHRVESVSERFCRQCKSSKERSRAGDGYKSTALQQWADALEAEVCRLSDQC